MQIPINGKFLEGNLVIPKNAHGIVLFAHGSGSSRHSPRKRPKKLQILSISNLLKID